MANILYRPIILLDIPVNEDSSRIFLPLLRPVEECRNRNGHLHKPVIIAWADESHTSFIPLVAGRSKNNEKIKFFDCNTCCLDLRSSHCQISQKFFA